MGLKEGTDDPNGDGSTCKKLLEPAHQCHTSPIPRADTLVVGPGNAPHVSIPDRPGKRRIQELIDLPRPTIQLENSPAECSYYVERRCFAHSADRANPLAKST